MTANQEEHLYDFLDNTAGTFSLFEAASYLLNIDPSHADELAAETAALINLRNLAFPAGKNRWLSRRGFFENLPFVISPSRLELVNGILIPGHRCAPFANPALLPNEYSFVWMGAKVPYTTSEGSPEEFYPFYSIFGEEYAPQYVARDNDENEAAFNSDPYDDPPEVSIQTLDMRNIYREAAFVPGDRFKVLTLDWKKGIFALQKVGKDEWSESELQAWLEAAEDGLEKSFAHLGTASSTEEQLTYAYWYGKERMQKLPAYSLEEFLFQKTDKIEITSYGIETRFWYAGQEIPDLKELDSSNTRPDKTPVEEILHKFNIPASEYVIQSYARDGLHRGEDDAFKIITRLVPPSLELESHDSNILAWYIESVLEKFRETYNPFVDNSMGSVRLRVGELHTAIIDLVANLRKGDIDLSWLPRHTFIILSQMQTHTASIMEDLNSDQPPEETELDAMDSSLDSMIETYEDIKELIDESLDSFRRTKLTLIRAGNNSSSLLHRFIHLSISGSDVWRKIVISENCTLWDLHQIIHVVFSQDGNKEFKFYAENVPKKEEGKSQKIISFQKRLFTGALNINTRIRDFETANISQLRYEYNETQTIEITLSSHSENHTNKLVRCVAGAGVLSAESEFDLDACNRNLRTLFLTKQHSGKEI